MERQPELLELELGQEPEQLLQEQGLGQEPELERQQQELASRKGL